MSEHKLPWGWAPQLGYGVLPDGTRVDHEGMITFLEQSLVHERQQVSKLVSALQERQAAVNAERQQREAAEAELGNAEALRNMAWSQRFEAENRCDALKSRTAKLLALADGLREALKQIASTPGVTAPRVGGDYARNTARAALATDLDAYVQQAKELGIDAGVTDVTA